MKINLIKYIFLILLPVFMVISGCTDFLEEDVFTEYDPQEFLQDESGIEALLAGAYSAIQLTGDRQRDFLITLSEQCTDLALESGGGLESRITPIMQFNWNPSTLYFDQVYEQFYIAIARANNVLVEADNIGEISEGKLQAIIGEARFVRAFSYYFLHNFFGPTPILEIPEGASLDEVERIGKETAKATEQEYRDYVEQDLLFAVNALEEEGLASRANKGSATALLAKFYLNNKQWDKAAEAANDVILMGYALVEDYTQLFTVESENNSEVIYKFECKIGTNNNNRYIAHAFPPNYPIQSNWANFGAQFRTFTAFYETFGLEDDRRKLFIDNYIEIGKTFPTVLDRDQDGVALDNVRSFKYTPDQNANGAENGNDVPYLRLSDMFLTRAEALNELNGPTEETFDLINKIRARANAPLVDLADFPDKERLRDFLLEERAREFYTEGFRREDLIRHGKFIQQAVDRGVAAEPFQVLFPLPQPQLQNNPSLVQNDGYLK
ncbi:MAG: RagB/SusD family nutrient uptake outer membrane protein [Sediminicola sp.]